MKEINIALGIIVLALVVAIIAPVIFAWSVVALFGWAFWPSFWLAFAAGIIIRGSNTNNTT